MNASGGSDFDITPKGGFKPPPAFIQASLARQSKIKELQQKRNEHNSSDSISTFGSKYSNNKLKSSSGSKKTMTYSNSIESPYASSHVMNSSASKSTSSIKSTNTSKTLMEIERLKQAREERRQKQAEDRKILEELNETDRANFIYHQLIDQFRCSFYDNLEDNWIDKDAEDDSNIKICVRKRPLNDKEKSQNTFDIITTKTGKYPNSSLFLHEPKTSVNMSKTIENHEFYFDYVYDEKSTNKKIYLDIAKPLVEKFFDGGKVTFFAYGQTGSGKTHTIFGPSGGKLLSELRDSTNDNYDRGIYEYACKDVFKKIEEKLKDDTNIQYILSLCFFEIYGGKVYDLFNGRTKVNMLEDKNGDMQIFGLKEIPVANYDDLQELLILGSQARTTGSTEANPDSSRSHAIFQMTLYTYPKQGNSNSEYNNIAFLLQQQQHVGIGNSSNDTYGLNVHGRFLLIDLAGSERGEDTGNISRQARIEGAEINKSLLALKECIRALHMSRKSDINSNHVPFRGSKLTQILRDSLVGKNSKSVMVATISPSSKSCEHSLNTLRYANRIKSYKSCGKSIGEKTMNISSTKQLKSLIEKKKESNNNRGNNSNVSQRTSNSARPTINTSNKTLSHSNSNKSLNHSNSNKSLNHSNSNKTINTSSSNSNSKSYSNINTTSSNKYKTPSSVSAKSTPSNNNNNNNSNGTFKQKYIKTSVHNTNSRTSDSKLNNNNIKREHKNQFSRSNSDIINSNSMEIDKILENNKDINKYHSNINANKRQNSNSIDELYELHNEINNNNVEGEPIVKNHSYTLKKCLEFEEEENFLLKKIAKNDFDVDFYLNRVEFIVENKLNLLQNLYSNIKSYKSNIRKN